MGGGEVGGGEMGGEMAHYTTISQQLVDQS